MTSHISPKFRIDELRTVAEVLAVINPHHSSVEGCMSYIQERALASLPYPDQGYLETGGWCVTAYLTAEGRHYYKVTLSGYGVEQYIKRMQFLNADLIKRVEGARMSGRNVTKEGDIE